MTDTQTTQTETKRTIKVRPGVAKLRNRAHEVIAMLTVTSLCGTATMTVPVKVNAIVSPEGDTMYLGIVPANQGGFEPGIIGKKGTYLPDKAIDHAVASLLPHGLAEARNSGERGELLVLDGVEQVKTPKVDPEERILLDSYGAETMARAWDGINNTLTKFRLGLNKEGGIVARNLPGGAVSRPTPEWFKKYQAVTAGAGV